MTFVRSSSPYQSWINLNDGGNIRQIALSHFTKRNAVQTFDVVWTCGVDRIRGRRLSNRRN